MLRSAIDELLIPSLRGAGFTGSFPIFRRITGAQTHVLWFSLDRGHGGGVEIELAKLAARTNTSVRDDYHRSIDIRNRKRVLLTTLVPRSDASMFWYEDAAGHWGAAWPQRLAPRLLSMLQEYGEPWWARRGR